MEWRVAIASVAVGDLHSTALQHSLVRSHGHMHRTYVTIVCTCIITILALAAFRVLIKNPRSRCAQLTVPARTQVWGSRESFGRPEEVEQ